MFKHIIVFTYMAEKKDVMTKMKSVARKILHLNKYLVVLALGVLIVGFLGDNSVVAHLNNQVRINELKREISIHNTLTRANIDQIDKMNFDKNTLERVARERYFMKTEDEDIFILSDDPRTPEMLTGNETVE